jgi:hypothetical protein
MTEIAPCLNIVSTGGPIQSKLNNSSDRYFCLKYECDEERVWREEGRKAKTQKWINV